MAENENRKIAEQIFAALNAHDLDRYTKFVDNSYVGESELAPGPVHGPAGVRQVLEMQFTAFPDFHAEVEQILTSGDHVIARWRMTGTHKGNLMGIAPTNKAVNIHGCSVVEIRNGKAVRGRIYTESARMFQQLGVLSLPKAATAR